MVWEQRPAEWRLGCLAQGGLCPPCSPSGHLVPQEPFVASARPGTGPKCTWLCSDANKAPSELQSPLLGVSWPRPAAWRSKATWGDVGGAQAAVLHWAWCPHRLVSSSGASAGDPLALRGITGSLPCRRGAEAAQRASWSGGIYTGFPAPSINLQPELSQASQMPQESKPPQWGVWYG